MINILKQYSKIYAFISIKEMKMSRKPVEIQQTDLEWKFIKGGGPGGQAINKTSNCVQLTHTPTGIQIKCQKSRDLETNKNYAIKALKEKLDEQINGTNSLANIKAQKLQKQKQRRQRRSNEKYGHNKSQEDVKQEIENE
ncbi:unnamed protein product [Paramecium octaurelia]|uniref:Prokaryotic-type class I peptide chain release factors domain-containing protein n=1 Tax=Paramecium octaurelia TaxID=43137 RepID=A0A8S1WK44_PAROT|nr:unnamed protein product [Paramecium octaurelia]